MVHFTHTALYGFHRREVVSNGSFKIKLFTQNALDFGGKLTNCLFGDAQNMGLPSHLVVVR